MMKGSIVCILLLFQLSNFARAEDRDGKLVLNRSVSALDLKGYYRPSNYDFKCFRQLSMCSSTGWSLRFKLRLNPFKILDREYKYLLFSTGAHEPHGDGLLIYLFQSKNTSYLEFGLKEFRNDQFAYYWQIEVDLEINKWIDVVATIKEQRTSIGRHNLMTLFFDGHLYRESQVENYTEIFVFEYSHIHSKETVIYGNDTGLASFDEILYYERVLTAEEIANVASDMISIGCMKPSDQLSQYIIPTVVDHWEHCRSECYQRKNKVAIYSPKSGQCACVLSFYELDLSFTYAKQCQCVLSQGSCAKTDEWHVFSVTHVIDLIDTEVGLDIRMADSTYLIHGRTRVQRNEGVEIIVTVKNERNLASLTVYGDIEGQEQSANSSSHELYITAGVVNLSWKSEGAKKVQFRADYRRVVKNEVAEYRTVYVDVVYVKTDLPLKFIHLSPDNRDGDHYQNFTVQTFGSIPINCTLDYGDGHRQTNGTNRHQYYTAYFSQNYTRYGQYNVSIRCFNELGGNDTLVTRTIRRRNLNQKMLITKDLMETTIPTRFNLISRDDYSFRHMSCLTLRNMVTQERMKLIWRKTLLEIVPTEVIPIGRHFYQLECDTVPLQPYVVNVRPAIRSLDIEASQKTIKTGQTVQFTMTLEPTLDLTILFDCGTRETPMRILHIQETIDHSAIAIGNCTYTMPGQFHPILSAINRINLVNQSIRIDVEPPLSPFKVEIEDRLDVNQLTLITLRASEPIAYEGNFQLTIFDHFQEKNQTRTERIQLFKSNNFTENLYLNITTYGRQTLHVRGGDYPTIREAQASFTVGTEITKPPQAYILNQMAFANEDFVWVDIQWVNGIGFDIEINFGQEKTVLLRYGQIITSVINRQNKGNDGKEQMQWKRLAKQRLQVGYKFSKSGTHKIHVTFIQPSTKLVNVEIRCPTVTIVDGIIEDQQSCFPEQQFALSSPNALNNISVSSSVLQLPYNLPHNLEPEMVTSCSETEFIYAFYLLSVDPSQWKYARSQRYGNSLNTEFQETLLGGYCSELGPKSSLFLDARTLAYGTYLAVFTVTRRTQLSDFRQFVQPIEIIRSDLISTFGGNQTIRKGEDNIALDFYYSAVDPDGQETDRRKLNFTLLCYPKLWQSHVFVPNTMQLGATRPTETNAQNHNSWSIQWSSLNLALRRPEINLQFYEHSCFNANWRKNKTKENIHFQVGSRTLNISEHVLAFNQSQLDFLLIIRHLTDARQLITRLEVDQEVNLDFASSGFYSLEDSMVDLDGLAGANPRKAVEFITGLAEKLNAMSDNLTTAQVHASDLETINDRMAAMRLKMLSSMDSVLNGSNDPNMMDRAIRASASVTSNLDQMPLDNQERGAGIIETVGEKIKEMESADEDTIIRLATSLMNVGSNVVQAASKTVHKDIDNDPTAIIETLESDVKETEAEETETKVLFAPTQFYDACDDCDSLPEDRWDEYRHKMDDEKKTILEGRERASNLVKRSSGGLFTIGNVLANRSATNETKTIQSKAMSMTFTKVIPDGKSTLSAGDSNIILPNLADLNSDGESSDVLTKVLESRDNPFASKHDKSGIQGSVVSIILSRADGSEMLVQNTTKPISIRLTRPMNKRSPYQQQELHGTELQYHKVSLPDPRMTLSVYVASNSTSIDTYAIYVSFASNESLIVPPTESAFDLLFLSPNLTANGDRQADEELSRTIFLPPSVHLGNGTYIFGIKLINSSSAMNLTEYNSSYSINMYVSKCQYWNEKDFRWSSEGCEVGPLTNLESTECLCTHLTTFGSDFYVPPNTINFKTVFTKFKKLHENAAVFSTVIVILGLYVIAAIWARRKDRRDLVKWTAAPLVDNLPIDTYHYLVTVHTGVGKESGTTSNVNFVISGETSDSGVRRLTDGKLQKYSNSSNGNTCLPKEFAAGSVRNFLMSVETPLGPLLYLRVWHDNSGQKGKASWFLNMINVMDLQTGEKNYFICDNWLAVEKNDGLVDRVVPVASEKELKSFSHLFTQSVKKKFSDGHLWFSVFSRPVRSNFTRLQRVSCCISLLFCTMISNAMFYRQETQATANKAGALLKIGPLEFTLTQLWISFISTMIVLPVNLIIVTLFRKAKYSQKTLVTHQLLEKKRRKKHAEKDEQYQKTRRFFSRRKPSLQDEEIERVAAIPSIEDKTRTFPHWTIYVAWSLVMLSILTCSFFVILYSMEWGAKRANEWLTTMMLSFGQSILVIDPLKVFLITAIISFLIRRPYDDETLDFNDPFTATLLSNESITDLEHHDVYNDANVKEIARQRRVRLFNLRPIDSNEMARAREQRLHEIKMGEIIREIVVYIFFTTVLLFLSYQSRDTNSYGLYRDTKNLFITDDFHKVNSIESWWNYCDGVLLTGLYAQPWYNDKNLTWREKLTTGSRVAMRVGAPRVRQLRIKENSCRVHRRVKHLITHCRDDYNWIEDDTKDYSTAWEAVLNKTAAIASNEENTNETKRCKTPWCYQSSVRTKSGPLTAIYKTYKGGGYVVALGRTYERAQGVLAGLRSQNWLDQLTRAVVIEFSLYNANVNLFSAVTLSFEMTSMGSIIQDHQIKIFRLYDHIGGYGLLVYIFELIFVLFTIYSLGHEIYLLVKQRREYFHKFWNTVSFITAVLSVTAIIMYGMKKTLTRLAIRSLRKTEMGDFVNFNALASFDEIYSFIVAMITFFTMLKFLKLLRFNQRMGMLSKSLRYARDDLSSFGFVFLIFMVAYAQMGFTVFGRALSAHKSFFTSLTTCFRMLLGEINAPDLFSVSRVYGPFYFLSFLVLVFIALLSIFLTILNDAFAHVKREMAASQQRNAMMDYMWSAFRKVAGINNQKTSDEEEAAEQEKMKQMAKNGEVPLAKFDADDL